MSKEYFDKEKQEYENIAIPEDLDFLVRKTLKEGKRKRNYKNINKWSTAVAGIVLAFVLTVNLFPKVAYAASLIPGLDKLVKLVTFDKGFDNAVKEGLTQEVNFEETQNGITLKVNGLAGDWKKLWVDYSIKNGSEIINGNNEKYIVSIGASLVNNMNNSGVGIGVTGINDEGDSYVSLSFEEFIEEFILEFKVYDTTNKKECIANFKIPISLNPDIFNSPLVDITLDNNIVETSVGNIIIDNIESSKTRVIMQYNFESDKYDFMGFENPRLIDNNGNEYKESNMYFIGVNGGNKHIEFEGSIEEVKSLKFKCDGVYYARKDKRNIVVNLKDKYVEENEYGIKFDSDYIDSATSNKYITLVCEDSKDLYFNQVIIEGKELIEEQSRSMSIDNNKYSSKVYIKLSDNLEKVELTINSIKKDITKPISTKLIK